MYDLFYFFLLYSGDPRYLPVLHHSFPTRRSSVLLDDVALAAFADPLQRLGQPRRRIVVHDPGRTLGAEHALVDRVVAVALDVADPAVLQMHLDAAAAEIGRAHV